jgi:hypothetical protein
VRRAVYLVTAALVAVMILVPTAMAQEMTVKENIMTETTMEPLPPSGGPAAGSVLLPAAALLVSSGILAYAVLRGR